jgi:hypothetical protein
VCRKSIPSNPTQAIDESYDSNQNVFALSCLIARGKTWYEMERKWKLHLAAKNKQLLKAGRPLISRYHASDCSGRRNEYDGWSHEERDAFVLGLFGIFKQTPVHTVVFDVQLDEVCEVFPEWSKDRMETAYNVLTGFLMYMIGEDFEKIPRDPSYHKEAKIALFHDRTGGNGKYDPGILRVFNQQMNDPNFPHRKWFTTIAPMSWEDCIALQPADLIAFECFKEAEARIAARKSRKSFRALLDMKAFGIHSKGFDKESLVKMRQHLAGGNNND